MVQVYVMDVTHLDDPMENPQILEGLDNSRKEKIMRCKQENTRKQSLGAGLLLRHILECHGLSEREIHFGLHGKPEIKGICFNLSHSSNMVVCAVSDKPVGCDVEKVREAPYKVADRFLNKNEKNYLEQYSGDEKNREFYRLWTMKESYVKMTGEGLSVAPNEIELRIDNDIKVCRGGKTQNCFLKEYGLQGYFLTVCAREKAFSENLNIVMTK